MKGVDVHTPIMFKRWKVFSHQFCYDICIGPSLCSSSQPIFMDLSFGFLPLRRLNKLLSYTKQLFLCPFAADAILKGRTPCLHLNALCVALGTRKCKHPSPDFFGSQFIIARVRNSFVFRDNVSSFSHRGSRTICLFLANLATPGNIRRNSKAAVYIRVFKESPGMI